ncbi:aldehyde dehydrogenase family protein [Fimbriiglobus ruber]|uniref:Aldehyde dehydrogenase n=1 Tax=Fimbriiglobus ruber TaxID=1908690 RepID=A0A225DI23_9BACT|nr:aldehyde dehydrogenase family protein [Fimbriiglobus ruber]OWK38218.1 Aldehyde dehydrogenase [Fimbriiglobus ruber]
MTGNDFGATVARHRKYFLSGATRSVEWREAQLTALQTMMTERAEDFYAAMWKDLRRNRIDADLTDVKFLVDEAAYTRSHLRRWMHPQVVSTPLTLAPAHTHVRFDPLGVGLIIGAWNYPVMLALSPLIAAISGGNAAVIKPSEVSAATAEVIARTVPHYLDPEAFSVVLGGVPETTALLEQAWDHIFFTGGPPVGKVVMTAAAKNLTPVVLELGGKNPTIVHSSADLATTARRIAQGRWLNAGQTCTAPDHVLVFKDVAKPFLEHLKNAVVAMYGSDPQKSPDYGRIVSPRHFDRLVKLLGSGQVYHGGEHDREDRFLAPTILVNVPLDSLVMQEEVFGPILPVIEVGSVEEVIRYVNARPNPLGLYVFAEEQGVAERILDATESGDAVVNDCTIQPLIHELPFGGVGNSGMGKYHGEWGFRAYTNARGVLYHSTKIDLGVRYPPYSEHQRLRGLLAHLPS